MTSQERKHKKSEMPTKIAKLSLKNVLYIESYTVYRRLVRIVGSALSRKIVDGFTVM